MRPRHAALLLCAVLAGCGARSGLEVSAGGDASADAGLRADGGVDGGVDAATCTPRVPPVEVCNARDDDCDGRLDEGLPYGPIAEAHALRTTEGDTGAEPLCSSCRWAWSPSIAPVRDGMLVPFHLGIYGGRERPSLFSRRTDAAGTPLGSVIGEGTSVPLAQRRMDAPGPDGATWIDAVLRVGTSDVPGWVIIDGEGAVRVAALSPTGGVRSVSVTLGDAVIAGWANGPNVRADAHRATGDGFRITSYRVLVPGIELGGLTALGLAARGDGAGAVLFVARFTSEPREFRLFAQRLGPTGEPDGEIVSLLDDGAPLRFLAATTDGGYLLFDPGNGSPATSRFVGDALSGVDAPVELLPGVDGSDLSFDFLRLPEGGFLVTTDDALVRLDARGAPQATWRGRLAPGDDEGNAYVVRPDLARVGDRTFVAWHGIAPDSTPNTVWIRELGCIDGP